MTLDVEKSVEEDLSLTSNNVILTQCIGQSRNSKQHTNRSSSFLEHQRIQSPKMRVMSAASRCSAAATLPSRCSSAMRKLDSMPQRPQTKEKLVVRQSNEDKSPYQLLQA